MTTVDTNILVYADREKIVRRLAESSAVWAIPWPQAEAWPGWPSVVLIGQTEVHWTVLKQILMVANVTGGLTHDARIAALCQQHGVSTLHSVDRDFSRFPGLRTVNPLRA